MSTALPALRIAVLGQGAPDFVQAVQQALGAWLPPAPLRSLHWQTPAVPACPTQVDLCWLLAWEESQTADAAQDLAALQAHQALRQQMHARGLSYQVLRGSLAERTMQALQALAAWLPELLAVLPRTGVSSRRPGHWACEACGDADCEHRSFTRLLAQRGR